MSDDRGKHKTKLIWFAVALLCVFFLFPDVFLIGFSAERVRTNRDRDALRALVRIVTESEPTPVASDGRIDVYAALARRGRDTGGHESLCYSLRLDRGATRAQIEARDFAAFPWVRGVPTESGNRERHPLLWEPRAVESGKRLVAFADGKVELLTEAEFQALAR